MRLILVGVIAIISLIYFPSLQAAVLHEAITMPIQTEQLVNYANYPPTVRNVIIEAANLSKKNLTYLYGSNDPRNKGMDCSGTIYFLLRRVGVTDVPRSSDGIYQWVKEKGKFHTIKSKDINAIEFEHLHPGDLLFWMGTYENAKADRMSHVMLYLGKDNKGQSVMFGSSDGRTYRGKQMWGVSLFDFNLPQSGSTARFIGYSCIPNLTCDL